MVFECHYTISTTTRAAWNRFSGSCHYLKEILEALRIAQGEKKKDKKVTSGKNSQLFDPVVKNTHIFLTLEPRIQFHPLESTHRQNVQGCVPGREDVVVSLH